MKKLVLTGSLLMCMMAVAPLVHGQGCSVCTKTAQGLDSKTARGLNGGIIYLAFLPLIIIGSVSIVWWRSKNSEQ